MKKKLFIAKMKDKEFIYANKEQRELVVAGKPAKVKKMIDKLQKRGYKYLNELFKSKRKKIEGR